MRKRLPIASLLFLVVACVAAGCSARSSAKSVTASVYWGAWIDGNVFGRDDAPWDSGTISRFEHDVGKQVSIIHFGQPWQNCDASTCTFTPFMNDAMDPTREHGAIPMVTWGSWARQNGVDQPAFRLARIAAGDYDDYIRTWALAAKAWGHPFFLRLDHEMNIMCCWPWAVSQNGNKVSDYVAMWRHVHDIFTSVGATNATWVWCPNRAYPGSAGPLSALYPGDAYVDWTCLDGYNWGPASSGKEPWTSFARLFGPSYKTITGTIAPSKPMMIGETGSAEVGGSKARWLTSAFSDLQTLYPKIKAFLWFNAQADGENWAVETSKSAQEAFRQGIESSRFSTNDFGSLAGGTIRPLPAK